ncbi:hypothetical protein SFRURICE_000057 [Spodoptera frugiperda]|uniref:SFRICE_027585 n=1 Tax=Spodoptera frugiperda TaxID=7108 RepID=A0A2H1W7L0_SPOFR|nr:hypothetical protein SFRURICE_000057 [Spodoptera frugiperda]
MMGHPTPVYLPVNIDDETFNAIITQRPDLKYILKEQRKNQLLHHNQMPYLLKKKNGSTEYEKVKQKPILLVENDDDDITKPLSDYNDGRTTVDIDPTLVIEPDRMMYQKYKKRRSNSTNKQRFKGPSRRGWELRWWPRTHEQYAWDNSWWAANCYNCWAYNRGGIHRNHLCHTAFHSQNWVYRTQKRYVISRCKTIK